MNGIQWLKAWKHPGRHNAAALAQHAAQNGVSVANIRWGQGDHASYYPDGEIRPGKFWWGGKVERDDNGDIVTPLYRADEPAPANAPMRLLFDAAAANGIGINFELLEWPDFASNWQYHPYNTNRINAAGNPSRAEQPGWLTSRNQCFTDPGALAAFKQLIDAFITSFGSHPALWCIDIGNEISEATDKENLVDSFFAWLEEISDYLWNALPGPDADKPFISVSQMRYPADRLENQCSHHLSVPPEKIMLNWHSYLRGPDATLQGIWNFITACLDDYPGSYLRVGSGWPWGAGPRPIPNQYQGINLPASSYEHNGIFEPMSEPPYPHERMFAFLVPTISRVHDYARWAGYVDGATGHYITSQRIAEITKTATEMPTTPNGNRHTINGDLRFQSANLTDTVLSFVLVGDGVQTVDFNVQGDWLLTTYDWTADNPTAIELATLINPAAAVIDFSQYANGFCPGYLSQLEKDNTMTERLLTQVTALEAVTATLRDIAAELQHADHLATQLAESL